MYCYHLREKNVSIKFKKVVFDTVIKLISLTRLIVRVTTPTFIAYKLFLNKTLGKIKLKLTVNEWAKFYAQ